MMQHSMLVLFLAPLIIQPISGQDARSELRQGIAAYDVADFGNAVPLLSRGLNPAAGPRDSLWVLGLHELAEALAVLGHDTVARAWVRWGVRSYPQMLVDQTFPPLVLSMFQEAREFVEANPTDPTVVRLSWRWSRVLTPDLDGAIILEQAEIPVSGRIQRGAFLTAGQASIVAPGSYSVTVTAAGYLPATFTLEVLPNVTSRVRLEMLPEASGYLYVTARPWAEVLLDGVSIGYTTVAARRIAPGEHLVRIQRDGFVPFDTVVTVAENAQVRLGPISLQRP